VRNEMSDLANDSFAARFLAHAEKYCVKVLSANVAE
jgi:hypothetical protein